MIMCPQCGQRNEDTISFCRFCGTRLTASAPGGYGANNGGSTWGGPATAEDDAPGWLRTLRDQQRGEMFGVPAQQQPGYMPPQMAPAQPADPYAQQNGWGAPAAPSAYGES